jgi:cobalt/nickel transport system permease protein
MNKKTELPNWLQQSDPQPQPVKRHNFLFKNSRRLTQLLQQLTSPTNTGRPLIKTTPQLQLVTLLVTLLLTLTSQLGWQLWLLGLYLLLNCLSLASSQLRRFLRNWLLTCCVAMPLILPSLWVSGPNVLLHFCLRTWLLLGFTQYFQRTITLPQLLSGLQALHLPNVLILVIDIACVYLKQLTTYLLASLEAVELRTIAATKHPYRLIAGLFGNLYLKSQTYALTLNEAMEVRGFNGHYQPTATIQRSHWRDYLILLPPLVLALVFYLKK